MEDVDVCGDEADEHDVERDVPQPESQPLVLVRDPAPHPRRPKPAEPGTRRESPTPNRQMRDGGAHG